MEEHNYLEYRAKESDEGREVLSVMREEMALTTAKIRSVKFNDIGILLDGVTVNVREKLHPNQLLRVLLDDVEKEQSIIAHPMRLDIVYEDESLMLLNKPSGIVCHPAQGHLVDTLINGVKAYFDATQKNSRIHLVGRLDKDTSGIVAIAKNSVVAERFQFSKTYYALVSGSPIPCAGDIEIPMEESLGGDNGRQLKMKVGENENGKYARTHYEVLETYTKDVGTYSLCKVQIETGRTHQIRFHMAHIGHPLLGDPLYGMGLWGGLKRAALHAGEVEFSHPMTREWMKIDVPMPEDMAMHISHA